jgi:alpha-L-fucosidase
MAKIKVLDAYTQKKTLQRTPIGYKPLLILSIILFAFLDTLAQDQVPIPTTTQLQWQNAELAALISIDLHVFDGKPYIQSENRITPIEDYNIFNPQEYDMDQWIKSLKDGGFKVAILTVSHETGFFFHQSSVTPYSMKALDWQDGKGDILRDFKASCEKYDILPGVYIGTRWNSFYGVYDFKVNGENEFARNRQKQYNRMIENVVQEIFTKYGEWFMVWFDGGAHGPEQGGPDVLSIFERHQPKGLFYHNLQRADMRWGGSESGTVPYPSWGTFAYKAIGAGETTKKEIAANNFQLLKTGDPNGSYYMPAMSDAPLRGNGGHDWFWSPNREEVLYPLNKLISMYYNSVGHNTSLILGVTPDSRGLLPKADVDRLKDFGDAITSRFANPIATGSGTGKKVALRLAKKEVINQVVIMEDITKGERIRKFIVEAKTDKGWQTLFDGSSIGHKFIYTFVDIETSKVRLRIKEAIGEPTIKNFEIFRIEDYANAKKF